jgi:MoxR-like ATPase
MNFKEAAVLFSRLPSKQAILLAGPPGIGKSTLAELLGEQLSKDSKVVVEVRDLCSHLPEDLLGLPWREDLGDGGAVTRYAPPAWLVKLSRPGVQGVLVLDDLGAASPAVQTAAFRLVLERKVGDCELSGGVRVVVTTNRREDLSRATLLPAALRNRCLIHELDTDLEDWCTWALANGVPPEIPAYLRWRPEHLSKLPKDADKAGAFATPRSWHMLGNCLKAAQAEEQVFDVAAGLVGSGVATEFVAFLRRRKALPDLRKVLEDPEAILPVLPTEPDMLRALASGMAELVAPLSLGKRRDRAKDHVKKLVLALAVTLQANWEFVSAAVQVYNSQRGDMKLLVEAMQEGRSDPRIAAMSSQLKGAFGGSGEY